MAFLGVADRMRPKDAAARWAYGHRIPGQARTRPHCPTPNEQKLNKADIRLESCGRVDLTHRGLLLNMCTCT